jgi:hypothetical protein
MNQQPKNLVDFIEARPIITPKTSPKINSELKKKIPSYMKPVSNEIDDLFGKN